MDTDDRAVAVVLRALAEPTRLGVVRLLSTGPRRAGELAEDLGVSPPALSKHLRVLLAAGVVSDERVPDDARGRVFRLRPDSVAGLRAWLDQLQAHWDEQLAAFRTHVERSIHVERSMHAERSTREAPAERSTRDGRGMR